LQAVGSCGKQQGGQGAIVEQVSGVAHRLDQGGLAAQRFRSFQVQKSGALIVRGEAPRKDLFSVRATERRTQNVTNRASGGLPGADLHVLP